MRRLADEADLNATLAAPGHWWLLKHSNTCPVSTAALEEVEAYLGAHDEPAVLVVVQEQRPLSNLIAERLRYAHQSPQLFLIEDGQVRFHASHWGITAAAMAAAQG